MEKVKNELSIHPIIAPAIVADNSDTIVPANIALKPSSINIGFTLGAITPIPPICIPIDAKFAKPHNI